MGQYIAFFAQHWGLGLLLLIILLAIAVYELRAKGIGPGRISAQKAVQLMNHDNAVVIDLRDCTSFEHGHIISAINIPINELEQKIVTLNKYQHKPMILVLASGQQSLQASKLFAKNDFTNVSILGGGMRAWREANLPVEK